MVVVAPRPKVSLSSARTSTRTRSSPAKARSDAGSNWAHGKSAPTMTHGLRAATKRAKKSSALVVRASTRSNVTASADAGTT